MKKILVIFATVAIAFALSGCPVPTFTATAISTADQTASQAAVNGADLGFRYVFFAPAGLTAGATHTAEHLTLNFNRAVDAASVTGIKIYTLNAAADADGARSRNVNIASAAVVGGKTVSYTLDLSGATISNRLEIAIDGSVLTAGGGTIKLNTDGDQVPGEALEDDAIDYVTVAGFSITALGAARNPQASVILSAPGGYGVGATVLTAPTFDAQLTQAALIACYGLQKLNPTTMAWDPVSYTGTLGTAFPYTFTMTLATAMNQSEIYRFVVNSPYNLQEAATVNGYKHRGNYDQSKTIVVAGTTKVGLVPAPTETTATVNSSTASFDSHSKNGTVTIVFAGLITATGIDSTTVTAANIRLYDSTRSLFVPWVSGSVYSTTTANDTIQLVLEPNYSPHSPSDTYYVYTFPGLKEGTLTFGDWTQISSPAYYFYKTSALETGL